MDEADRSIIAFVIVLAIFLIIIIGMGVYEDISQSELETCAEFCDDLESDTDEAECYEDCINKFDSCTQKNRAGAD